MQPAAWRRKTISTHSHVFIPQQEEKTTLTWDVLVTQCSFCKWLQKEGKRKKPHSSNESLVCRSGLLGSKQRSHSCCPKTLWILEESYLLLVPISHFGMGVINSGSWVFLPFFSIIFYLHSSVGLVVPALQSGSPTFLFQWLQGEISLHSYHRCDPEDSFCTFPALICILPMILA